jgi:dTDP-glucose pyrophosphorylase
MQAVILAAGRGKRLHPITESRTKAMAPILGQPIVGRVMEPLMACGIHDFILVISPDDNEIRDYFQAAAFQNIKITLVEQPKPLGMAHALSQASPYIKDDFVLSACDNLVPWDDIEGLLSRWRGSSSAQAILTLLPMPREALARVGVVKLEGDVITQIVEKPEPDQAPSNIASTPLYCFKYDFLSYLPAVQPSLRGEYELQDAIQILINSGDTARGFRISKRIDLTTPEDLLQINLLYFERLNLHWLAPDLVTKKGSEISPPCFIQERVHLGLNCKIGPNVFIEHDCTIADGVTLKNSVVLRGREIQGGQYKNQVVY